MLSVTNNLIMLSVVMLSVVMLSVVMLSVIMQSFFMLSVVMLTVIMLSVTNKPNMLSVVLLSVVLLSVVLLSVIMLSVVEPPCAFKVARQSITDPIIDKKHLVIGECFFLCPYMLGAGHKTQHDGTQHNNTLPLC